MDNGASFINLLFGCLKVLTPKQTKNKITMKIKFSTLIVGTKWVFENYSGTRTPIQQQHAPIQHQHAPNQHLTETLFHTPTFCNLVLSFLCSEPVWTKKYNKKLLSLFYSKGLGQWFPTFTPGTSSAPWSVLKCSPKKLKSPKCYAKTWCLTPN